MKKDPWGAPPKRKGENIMDEVNVFLNLEFDEDNEAKPSTVFSAIWNRGYFFVATHLTNNNGE